MEKSFLNSLLFTFTGSRRKEFSQTNYSRVPIPRSSGVPGTMESQKAAQIPATAMGVFMIAQSTCPAMPKLKNSSCFSRLRHFSRENKDFEKRDAVFMGIQKIGKPEIKM